MVKWDLDQLYKEEDKDKLKQEITTLVDNFVLEQEKLTPEISPEDFLALVKQQEIISEKISVLVIRNNLALSTNTKNSELRKISQELATFQSEIANKLLPFDLFFKHLEDDKAKKIINESGKYKFALESARKEIPFTKSDVEEKILNIKSTTSSNALVDIHDIFRNTFRFTHEGKEKTQSEMVPFMISEDVLVRKAAYNSLLKTWEKNEALMGEVYKFRALDWYNNSVKIRGHSSSISARNFANDIEDSTVKLFLDIIREKVSIFQEYFSFKAKLLGFENERCHIYAPYIQKEKKTYDYETSKKIVLDLMKEFSPLFEEKTKLVFDNNKIDSEIREEKQGGAFCYQILKNTIPYVLLNHNNEYMDLSTMAHELGHAVHNQLSEDKTSFTWHPSIPLAEVASTFAEKLLSEKIVNESSNTEEKKYILFNEMDSYFKSILRQAYFCLFEMEAHEKIKEGASVDELHEIHYKLQKERFGDMIIPDEFKREWLGMPHIHHYPFYVYSYAFANLTTLALFDEYKKDKSSFVPKYTDILRAGGDDTVENIMSQAGFDISKKEFWYGAFDQIEQDFKTLKDLCQ